jgi:hypothetical protein
MKTFYLALILPSILALLFGLYPETRPNSASFSQSSAESQLDQYGGSPRLRCSNKTGHFILTKLNNRWWFCDPAGNVFIAVSVGGVGTIHNPTRDCSGINAYPILTRKYGDTTYNWGWQTLKRMTSWGFNSVGQDSVPFVKPGERCAKCDWPKHAQPIPLPYLTESKPAEYASINQSGLLSEPIKDEISGTDNNYRGWRGGALYDVFDPKLDMWWRKALADASRIGLSPIRSNDPYLLGVLTDDSDYFWGAGAGPDFASGHTSANVAWMTLITSPMQTFTQSTPFGNRSFLYQIDEVYSKALATNPKTLCSTQNPCSLRDYLWQKYGGSIKALNKAWKSDYTSFDSTGTKVNGEMVATGDGERKVFTYKLSHVPISPYSVLFRVDGTAKGGDCPWFHRGCEITTSKAGSLGSPIRGFIEQSSSTINYTTGDFTISFEEPPSKGTSITVDYTYGGWMAGGTGLMDEDGSHTAWVGTNPFCLEGANSSYPKFFSCSGGRGKNPAPNANPALGEDLDNWVPQFSAKYFKTMHDDLKAVSKLPYFGLDVLGSWGAPAYSKLLEGAAPYVDGAFVGIQYWEPKPSPEVFESAYQYLTQYLGDKPMMTFSVIRAQSDSSMYCRASPESNNMPDQATRGQMWYNMVQYLLTTPGHNGDMQFVGFDWWSWMDSQNLNMGLVTLHDNAYDGHEAVVKQVPCSPPLEAFTCGGEEKNYGDAIDKVRQANSLWYKLLP